MEHTDIELMHKDIITSFSLFGMDILRTAEHKWPGGSGLNKDLTVSQLLLSAASEQYVRQGVSQKRIGEPNIATVCVLDSNFYQLQWADGSKQIIIKAFVMLFFNIFLTRCCEERLER